MEGEKGFGEAEPVMAARSNHSICAILRVIHGGSVIRWTGIILSCTRDE